MSKNFQQDAGDQTYSWATSSSLWLNILDKKEHCQEMKCYQINDFILQVDLCHCM